MAAPATPRSTFGEQLHAQLGRHETIKSVRRLGRELSPERPDSGRRLLHEWIAGSKRPTKASRRAVAAALGVDASAFADGDDDEEEDLLPKALLNRIAEKMGTPEVTAFDLLDTVDESDVRRYRRDALHSLAQAAHIEKELGCRAS